MTANAALYGFRYAGSRHGNTPKPEVARVASAYQASASGSVHLRPGDPVKKANDGTVVLAAAGDALYAVIVAILPYYNSTIKAMDYSFVLPGGTTYSSQKDESRVMILPVAGTLFEVDADDNTTFTTEATYIAAIGENTDHSLNRDATNLWAAPLLDISLHGTATAQWRIVDIGRERTLDFSGTRVKLIVTANEVQEAPFQTTGV